MDVSKIVQEMWEIDCFQMGNFEHSSQATKNANKVFEWLCSAYTEPQRFYHNFDHIVDCHKKLTEWHGVEHDARYRPPTPNEAYSLVLAIWFHDAVYNTQASDNEEKSAELCRNACGVLGLDKEVSQKSTELILQTKHHCIEDPNLWGSFLMNDIDLSILGEAPDIFDKYEKNIRKEYEWAPLEEYNIVRKFILEKFQKRNYIYLTDYFSNKYEAQARQNIAKSLSKL